MKTTFFTLDKRPNPPDFKWDWGRIADSYFTNSWPIQPVPEHLKIESYAAITEADRKKFLFLLVKEFLQQREALKDPTFAIELNALKTILRNKLSEQLEPQTFINELEKYVSGLKQYDLANLELQINFRQPLSDKKSLDSRFVSTSGAGRLSHHFHALSGSTYTSLVPVAQTNVLDAFHSEYTTDADGAVSGFIVAVSDGCGHFQAKEHNQLTANVARFLTTRATELLRPYPTPDSLSTATLKRIVAILNEETKQKFHLEDETDFRATLTVVKAFRIGQQYELLGFSIGKTMLLGINTEKNSLVTLVPARQNSDRMTDSIPGLKGNENEIKLIQQRGLPASMAVIPVSDGVYDCFSKDRKRQYPVSNDPEKKGLDKFYLAYKEHKEYKVDDTRTDVIILSNAFEPILRAIPPHSNAETYLSAIHNAVIQRTQNNFTEFLSLNDRYKKLKESLGEIEKETRADKHVQDLTAKRQEAFKKLKGEEKTKTLEEFDEKIRERKKEIKEKFNYDKKN